MWLLLFVMPGGFLLAPLLYLAARTWMRHVHPELQPVLQRLSAPADHPHEAAAEALVSDRASRAPA
jgi:hypothetical protein